MKRDLSSRKTRSTTTSLNNLHGLIPHSQRRTQTNLMHTSSFWRKRTKSLTEQVASLKAKRTERSQERTSHTDLPLALWKLSKMGYLLPIKSSRYRLSQIRSWKRAVSFWTRLEAWLSPSSGTHVGRKLREHIKIEYDFWSTTFEALTTRI